MRTGGSFPDLQCHSTPREPTLRIAFIAMALVAAAPLAQAEGNGEHPAIVARRVIASQGYDYASAFYLHPAGLSLATRPQPSSSTPALAQRSPRGVPARPAH
jgi:hypothetical protein